MNSTFPLAGLEDDPLGAHIVQEEQRLLSTVLGSFHSSTQESHRWAERHTREAHRLLELRSLIAEAKPEDLPALFDQMHQLGALHTQRQVEKEGGLNIRIPYFAHVRLEEGGKRRDVLIGNASYLANTGFRIVDWRQAPVSRIYYRYGEGEEYEEQLGNRLVEGIVILRRNVTIREGELVRITCPQGTFAKHAETGVWQRVQHASGRLQPSKERRSILCETGEHTTLPHLALEGERSLRQDKHLMALASELDAAQFELVTRLDPPFLAIQGGAGSGKTTVGLHRIAYLAFSDPVRFAPEHMLVIVPNEALIHYVSRLLPALGVEGVRITTFGRFAARLLQQLLPSLPTRVSGETPPMVSRAKSHPAMLFAIQEIVFTFTRALSEQIAALASAWPEGEKIASAWEGTATRATPLLRLYALYHWLVGRPPHAAPAALPAVTRGALEALLRKMIAQSRNVIAIWDELITDRGRWQRTFAATGAFRAGQLDQIHAWCVRQARVLAEPDRDGEIPALDAEDGALLLCLWQSLRGPLPDVQDRPYVLEHLFVDEVQDENPIALRVLLDLTTKSRCVTFAGDTAQRLAEEGDERGEFEWQKLLHDLDLVYEELEPLRVSYRSTAEITSFAAGVLGPYAHEAEPIATRHGPPVELLSFSTSGEAVGMIAEALRDLTLREPSANVAVLSRFAPHADTFCEGLVRAEVHHVRRIFKQDFSWKPGVDVTDVRQTKGLEFDIVILIEANRDVYPDTASARHTVYVGATRAAHQLWCVATHGQQAQAIVDGLAAQQKMLDPSKTTEVVP